MRNMAQKTELEPEMKKVRSKLHLLTPSNKKFQKDCQHLVGPSHGILFRHIEIIPSFAYFIE
jgi:hypothetical protein